MPANFTVEISDMTNEVIRSLTIEQNSVVSCVVSTEKSQSIWIRPYGANASPPDGSNVTFRTVDYLSSL
jgi:hypothetical protein